MVPSAPSSLVFVKPVGPPKVPVRPKPPRVSHKHVREHKAPEPTPKLCPQNIAVVVWKRIRLHAAQLGLALAFGKVVELAV